MTPILPPISKTTVVFALYGGALSRVAVVGLVMSLMQSVTSMQEPTLTFIPKLLATSALALLLTPWLLRSLAEFTITTFARMGSMGH